MSLNLYYNIAKNELFPICRSITGFGIKKTLQIIKREFPELKLIKTKSGTKVFDWKIPPEWNVKDAYVLDKYNNKIINFKLNNLHLVGYSVPVNKIVKKKELLKHIHTIDNQSNAIPYITSYYKKYWGFCLTKKNKSKIDTEYSTNDKFKVVIQTSLNSDGNLVYGEIKLPGKSKKEILISTYVCHPSMANNELSGPIVSMSLINYFKKIKNLKYTLRFLFIPETIGSITFLSKNKNYLNKFLLGGYNLTCIGDNRRHSCLLSKYENSLSDLSLIEAYNNLKIKYIKHSFLEEKKSDERQYNSPGIDLPIAAIYRSKPGHFKEYHTSLDNFKLVTIDGVQGGYNVAKKAIQILMNKVAPKNVILCEPQMGKRNLYPNLSTKSYNKNKKNIMNFLQYSDGRKDLNEIAKIIKVNRIKANKIYKLLLKNKLIF